MSEIPSVPSNGAVIVVYRVRDGILDFLLLHRSYFVPEFSGDWAWGPPSGTRQEIESIETCAERELLEETGFQLSVRRTLAGSDKWWVYVAEASPDGNPVMSDEHDRYVWLQSDVAEQLISPAIVRSQFVGAVQHILRGRTR
jgi:8-oxo-dGTP pyrophosphatase MutT (NUDIX family)